MITIVNYGLGNIAAFSNLYKRLNIPAKVARTAADLADAERIILPGVGAFDYAMGLLDASGMRETLDELVVRRKVPIVGICVGMQILADGSDEGVRKGLGWIPGRVRAFAGNEASKAMALPHMGWNDVAPAAGEALFRRLEDDARFYFLHSYFFECADPAHVVATADYGLQFSCAVRKDNVHGVQFHPEKSHHYGARLLKNFSEI